MKRILILLMFIISCAISIFAQDKNNVCYKWQTQVDPKLERIEIDESSLNDNETLEAINCLLSLKGNKNQARFTGYTNVSTNVASTPPRIKKSASVEIAALYYISYIFYNNWKHAGSVRLYDENTEESNSKRNVKRAFKSYQEWYKRLSEFGLQKAREQKLDPLENSGISWS